MPKARVGGPGIGQQPPAAPAGNQEDDLFSRFDEAWRTLGPGVSQLLQQAKRAGGANADLGCSCAKCLRKAGPVREDAEERILHITHVLADVYEETPNPEEHIKPQHRQRAKQFMAAVEANDVEKLSSYFQECREEHRGEIVCELIIAAAQAGHVDTIKCLAKYASDNEYLDMSDSAKGARPLMFAAHNGHVAAVRQLLELGADPNAVDDHGYNALTISTFCDRAGVAEVLCQHKETIIDQVDERERTALCYAALYGSDNCVHVLAAHGANVYHEDDEGADPLNLAEQSGRASTAEALRKLQLKARMAQRRADRNKLEAERAAGCALDDRERARRAAEAEAKAAELLAECQREEAAKKAVAERKQLLRKQQQAAAKERKYAREKAQQDSPARSISASGSDVAEAEPADIFPQHQGSITLAFGMGKGPQHHSNGNHVAQATANGHSARGRKGGHAKGDAQGQHVSKATEEPHAACFTFSTMQSSGAAAQAKQQAGLPANSMLLCLPPPDAPEPVLRKTWEALLDEAKSCKDPVLQDKYLEAIKQLMPKAADAAISVKFGRKLLQRLETVGPARVALKAVLAAGHPKSADVEAALRLARPAASLLESGLVTDAEAVLVAALADEEEQAKAQQVHARAQHQHVQQTVHPQQLAQPPAAISYPQPPPPPPPHPPVRHGPPAAGNPPPPPLGNKPVSPRGGVALHNIPPPPPATHPASAAGHGRPAVLTQHGQVPPHPPPPPPGGPSQNPAAPQQQQQQPAPPQSAVPKQAPPQAQGAPVGAQTAHGPAQPTASPHAGAAQQQPNMGSAGGAPQPAQKAAAAAAGPPAPAVAASQQPPAPAPGAGLHMPAQAGAANRAAHGGPPPPHHMQPPGIVPPAGYPGQPGHIHPHHAPHMPMHGHPMHPHMMLGHGHPQHMHMPVHPHVHVRPQHPHMHAPHMPQPPAPQGVHRPPPPPGMAPGSTHVRPLMQEGGQPPVPNHMPPQQQQPATRQANGVRPGVPPQAVHVPASTPPAGAAAGHNMPDLGGLDAGAMSVPSPTAPLTVAAAALGLGGLSLQPFGNGMQNRDLRQPAATGLLEALHNNASQPQGPVIPGLQPTGTPGAAAGFNMPGFAVPIAVSAAWNRPPAQQQSVTTTLASATSVGSTGSVSTMPSSPLVQAGQQPTEPARGAAAAAQAKDAGPQQTPQHTATTGTPNHTTPGGAQHGPFMQHGPAGAGSLGHARPGNMPGHMAQPAALGAHMVQAVRSGMQHQPMPPPPAMMHGVPPHMLGAGHTGVLMPMQMGAPGLMVGGPGMPPPGALMKGPPHRAPTPDSNPPCLACLHNPRNAACGRCWHTVLCIRCANQLAQARGSCPACNQPLDNVVDISNYPGCS